jgi:type II secretory ATPase GspE/PulE/Tfp pilus assembly ATPase PilB-like protein
MRIANGLEAYRGGTGRPGDSFVLPAILQFAIRNSQFAIAFLTLVQLPGLATAAGPTFPRGPGFYFHPLKFLLILIIYFCWIRTVWWVSLDCRVTKMPAGMWNSLIFGSGVLGLLIVWLLPIFWLSFPVLVLLYVAGSLTYVGLRNEKVEPERRVLTPRHLRILANRWLRLGLKIDQEQLDQPIPLRFIGKSADSREVDGSRVAQAQGSRGYQAALEMVYEAIQLGATDIHLEPTKEEMTVRYRIDGILQATSPFGRPMGDAVINIFKVLADLDITEKRKPQDGSFSAEVTEDKPLKKRKSSGNLPVLVAEGERDKTTRQIDFRVATAGSVTGEKLVMRILDKSRQLAGLAQIGMREKMREEVRGLVTQPHGMLIVCGPTGAGKSTTLYACLAEIDRYQKNVITVENPVEYHIDNVTQIEINPKAGKTFASELRSILRQDPDVIYVGEVRDHETAEIACQAAQTGHMVFTTLHANDTVTALGRLLDLGVQPFMVASAVSAILGQRLVRVLCPKCKQRYRPNPDMLRKANLPVDKITHFFRPPERPEMILRKGDDVCPVCGGTGYRGRTGIFELLVMTDTIRALIRENPNLNAIRAEAVKSGMKYLQEDGLRQVIEGRTSIQELLRVCK